MRIQIIVFRILSLTLFFSVLNYSQLSNIDSVSIYLVKENWHTGLMIPVNEYTRNLLPVMKYFEDFEYIDIGWGDEDFYQTPGSNWYFAAKAILIPTPTVLRIDGYRFPIERVVGWRDFAIQFILSNEEFQKLCKFINESFKYNDNDEVIVSLVNEKRTTIFFKSVYYYSCLRTCNTWAAEAIASIGYDVDTFGLVNARQLFSKLSKYGKVLKREE